MTFEYRQLRAFVATADSGSIGRAAIAVHMSQPTLSRQLAELERRAGQALFERQAKGMVLTAAGELLLPHARLLLFEAGQARDALDSLRGLRRGVARIGSVATIARSILPGVLAALLDESPGLRVTLVEQPDDRLVAALLRREIDLVLAGALPTGKDLHIIGECRYDDRYAAFCAVDHPLAMRKGVTLAMVLAERWTMPSATSTPRDLFDAIVAAAGQREPDVAIETGSLDAMIAMVAGSRLLGWLPAPLLAAPVAAGMIRLLDVAPLALARRFFVYRRNRGVLPAAATRFVDLLPLIGRADPLRPSEGISVS